VAKKPPPKPAKPIAKAAPAKHPPDAFVARSSRELGELVGKSHTAVLRWIKDSRWKFGAGPWRASIVGAIKEWARSELAEAAGGDDSQDPADAGKLSIKTKADVQLKMTRNKLLVHQYELLTGKVHPVEQCQRDRLRAIHEMRLGLLTLADGLPTDTDTRTIVHGRVLELLRRFARGMGITDPNVMDAVVSPAAAGAGR
jgi:hypothetical protein